MQPPPAEAYTPRFRLEDVDDVALLAALGVSTNATAWPPGGLRASLGTAPRIRWADATASLGRELARELRARAEALGYEYGRTG